MGECPAEGPVAGVMQWVCRQPATCDDQMDLRLGKKSRSRAWRGRRYRRMFGQKNVLEAFPGPKSSPKAHCGS
jgi:hypothetical protein